MSKPTPSMVVQIIAVAIQCLLHWQLVQRYGLQGVAYSMIIVCFLRFAGVLAYTLSIKKLNFASFDYKTVARDVFDLKKLKEYLKIGIPASLFLILEWGAFNGLTIIAGYIPDQNYMAAQVIMFNMVWVYCYAAYGVSQALTTLIGNAVGADNVPLAKRIGKITMIFSVIIHILSTLCLFLLRKQIA